MRKKVGQFLKTRKYRLFLLFFFLIIVGIGSYKYYSSFSIKKSAETSFPYAVSYGQIGEFEKEIKEKGAQKVYQDLQNKSRDIPFATQHNIAHLFGKALYNVLGTEGIGICDQTMSFGCYHGIFVSAILKEGTPVIKTLDHNCKLAGQNLYTGCQHGIGHGLVEFYGRTKLKEALTQCLEVQKNLLVGCSSGVFMEYFFPSPLNEAGYETVKIDPKHPFLFCEPIDKVFKNSCTFELPRLWKQTEKDFSKLTDRCETLIKEPDLYKSCYRGLGFATGNSLKPNPDFSLSSCLKTPTDLTKLYCLSGATWFYSTINRTQEVLEAMQSLCTHSVDRHQCMLLSDLHLDQIEEKK